MNNTKSQWDFHIEIQSKLVTVLSLQRPWRSPLWIRIVVGDVRYRDDLQSGRVHSLNGSLWEWDGKERERVRSGCRMRESNGGVRRRLMIAKWLADKSTDHQIGNWDHTIRPHSENVKPRTFLPAPMPLIASRTCRWPLSWSFLPIA